MSSVALIPGASSIHASSLFVFGTGSAGGHIIYYKQGGSVLGNILSPLISDNLIIKALTPQRQTGLTWACLQIWILFADIDECREDPQICGSHAICNNLPGTFRCECEDGYQFGSDGQTCIGGWRLRLQHARYLFCMGYSLKTQE